MKKAVMLLCALLVLPLALLPCAAAEDLDDLAFLFGLSELLNEDTGDDALLTELLGDDSDEMELPGLDDVADMAQFYTDLPGKMVEIWNTLLSEIKYGDPREEKHRSGVPVTVTPFTLDGKKTMQQLTELSLDSPLWTMMSAVSGMMDPSISAAAGLADNVASPMLEYLDAAVRAEGEKTVSADGSVSETTARYRFEYDGKSLVNGTLTISNLNPSEGVSSRSFCFTTEDSDGSEVLHIEGSLDKRLGMVSIKGGVSDVSGGEPLVVEVITEGLWANKIEMRGSLNVENEGEWEHLPFAIWGDTDQKGSSQIRTLSFQAEDTQLDLTIEEDTADSSVRLSLGMDGSDLLALSLTPEFENGSDKPTNWLLGLSFAGENGMEDYELSTRDALDALSGLGGLSGLFDLEAEAVGEVTGYTNPWQNSSDVDYSEVEEALDRLGIASDVMDEADEALEDLSSILDLLTGY